MTIPTEDKINFNDVVALQGKGATKHKTKSKIIIGDLCGPVIASAQPIFSLCQYVANREAKRAEEDRLFAATLAGIQKRNTARAAANATAVLN